jgi:hypothetical protein
VVLAGAVAAFGTLFYVLGIVSAVVLVPTVLLLRRRIRDVVMYSAAFVLVAGAVSYGAYRYAAPPHQTFGRYLLGESRSTDYSASAIPKSIISIGQDVATTNWAFAYHTVGQRLAAAFPGQYLLEEQYVGDHSDAVVRVVPLLTVPLLFLLAAAVLWSLRHYLRARELRRTGVPAHADGAQPGRRLLDDAQPVYRPERRQGTVAARQRRRRRLDPHGRRPRLQAVSAIPRRRTSSA